jgi:hypothetical protein
VLSTSEHVQLLNLLFFYSIIFETRFFATPLKIYNTKGNSNTSAAAMTENVEQEPDMSASIIHCVDSGTLSICHLLGCNNEFGKPLHRSHCCKRYQHLIFNWVRGMFRFWALASVFIHVGLPMVSAQGYDTVPRPCSKDSQRFCSRCENTTRSIR